MGCRAVTHVVEVIITRDAEFSFPDSSSNVSDFNQTSSIDTRHVLSLGHNTCMSSTMHWPRSTKLTIHVEIICATSSPVTF